MIFQNVSFSYGDKEVIKDLSFSLKSGEILAVMGESGCGKTTLLHLAAGLLKPIAGRILREPHEKIAYVFQEPRLFPWLTVRQNVEAVLSSPRESAEKVTQILQSVGLADSAELYPRQLSGGMKSRVSLARALVFDGNLLLLDEPFAALNEALRQELSTLLKEHLRKSGASAILVTHQRSDANALADRILELS